MRMSTDRGSATVLAVGVLVLALVLAAGVTAVGQVSIARNRVTAAAEAGALAAAPVTFRPFGAYRICYRRGGPAGPLQRSHVGQV